jgi:hypothetical protein
MDRNNVPSRTEGGFLPDAEVAEVTLLLPGGQAFALERVAHQRRLTVGQLIRRLIRDYLVSDGQRRSSGIGDQAE